MTGITTRCIQPAWLLMLTVLTACGGGTSLPAGVASGTSGNAVPPAVSAPAATPTIAIALAANNVKSNQPSVLSWTANDASACMASGAWNGATATSGTLTISQSSPGSYTYALSCTGPGGTGNASATLTVVAPVDNVLAVTIDRGLNGNAFNQLFASVTICVPGTATCQTVDHVIVDTGSYGLRLLASAVNLAAALPAVTDAAGSPIASCTHFVSGYTWGSVRRTDLRLAGETAANLPVQLIGDTSSPYATVPVSCSNVGADLGTVSVLGANGILGVGLFTNDCPACTTSVSPGIYFACTNGTCTSTVLPAALQVTNPVPRFDADNNGIVLTLPAVSSGGVDSLNGTLLFGVGTQSNNQLGPASVYTVDNRGYLTTTYKGVPYASSFIDSGSNAIYFPDADIPVCDGFLYCPASTITLSATNISASGAVSGNVDFSIDNGIRSLLLRRAAVNIGGANAKAFEWGLPFFYGRTVFVAINGAVTPAGKGPYIAY